MPGPSRVSTHRRRTFTLGGNPFGGLGYGLFIISLFQPGKFPLGF